MAAASRRDFERAVDLLGTVLRGGEDASLRFNRAVMLQQLGRHADAIADYDRALSMKRDDPEAFFNRAVSREALGQPYDALEDYSKALALRPHHVPTLNNRGSILATVGKPEDALADFTNVLKLDPRDIRTLYNMGNALRQVERYEDSLLFYDRALAFNPRHVDAWNNRALSLGALYRWDEAQASIEHALQFGVTLERQMNRAYIFMAQNRTEDAVAAYNLALVLEPDNPEALHAKAGALLALGRYAEAWPLQEARWRASEGPRLPIQSSPLWLGGTDIAGHTLLLHGEQGLGDTIQFCRYARVLAARGAEIVLRVQPKLKGLLSEGLEGAVDVIGYDEPAPSTNFHIPLMSAPLACGTSVETIPSAPYLRADSARIAAWRERIGPGPLIGLTWRGDMRNAYRRKRSIALEQLAPLFGDGGRFVSLQMEVSDEEQALLTNHGIAHFGEELRDFREHAALTNVCDLVITIDTVVAHLAGALGRPTWILLPLWSDWRWMIDREDSPWLPTARLFRQTRGGDWDDVVARVKRALAGAHQT